jgi:hypothetical protein
MASLGVVPKRKERITFRVVAQDIIARCAELTDRPIDTVACITDDV